MKILFISQSTQLVGLGGACKSPAQSSAVTMVLSLCSSVLHTGDGAKRGVSVAVFQGKRHYPEHVQDFVLCREPSGH